MMDSNHGATFSTGSGHRCGADDLSYAEMTTDATGRVMSKQTKEALRRQHGYCLTCTRVPILLFDIRRSRMNPLWSSKKPRTAAGESLQGKCLKCNPELDPRRKNRPNIPSAPSFHSSRSGQSLGTSISSLSSLESFDAESLDLPEPRFDHRRSGESTVPRSQSRSRQRLPPVSSHSARLNAATSSGVNSIRSNSSTPLGRSVTERHSSPSRRRRAATMESNSSSRLSRDTSRGLVSLTNRSLSYSSTSMGDHRDQGTAGKIQEVNAAVSAAVSLEDHQSFADSTFATHQSGDTRFQSVEFNPGHSNGSSEAVQESAPDRIITDLKSLMSEMKTIGCPDILSESLVTSMEAHRSDERVQSLCLATITDSFNDEGFDSTVFVAASGDVRVLDALKAFPSNLEIQERGCNAIGILATNEYNRMDLIKHGACMHLIKAISRHLGDALLVTSAFTALRILSTVEEGRNSLRDMSLSKIAAEAMQCNMSNASIQCDGCAILSNMAVDAVNKEVSVVCQSEIAVIIQAMHRHSGDESVMASACFAIKNFAYNEDNLHAMSRITNSRVDIVEALQSALKFDSILLLEQTIEKIYIVRAQDESSADQAHKNLKATVAAHSDSPTIISDVIDTLEAYQWSNRMVAACLKIIKSLALTSEPHKKELLKSISAEKFSSYTKPFASDEAIQGEASVLLELFQEASTEHGVPMSAKSTTVSA